MTAYRARTERADLVALDHNEGPPVDGVLRELWAMVDPEDLRRYRSAARLERSIADRLGVDPSEVLVTAGGDEAIDRCARVALGRRRAMVAAEPTFDMFACYGRQAGADLAAVEWPAGAFPTAAIIGAVRRGGPRLGMVPIVSPNNPTGEVADGDALLAISAAAPDAMVVVDHAYVEYGGEDLTRLALRLPNAVTIRTFSKAWGLAGCRVGYVVGRSELVERLRSVGGPYPVAATSLALAELSLERGGARLDATIATTRAEREQLQAWLYVRGIAQRASVANFVVFAPRSEVADAPTPGESRRAAVQFCDAMASRGFAIKALAHSLEGWVRITMPCDEAIFKRLCSALEATIGSTR